MKEKSDRKKNFLKCVNFILNVISTGMNDDHIRYFASSWSDVVYISSVMAVGWHLILTESSLQTFHMLNGQVMQIEKALINDRLRVLKVF